MSWKAVLFDMDGVLIDSEEYMAKTGVRALKKYGIEAKESDFAEFVGEMDLVLSPAVYWAVEHGTSIFKELRKQVYLIKNRGK